MNASKTIRMLLLLMVVQASSAAQVGKTNMQGDSAPLSATAMKLLRSHIGKSGAMKAPGHGFNLLSAKDEQQMGDEVEADILSSAELLNDSSLTDYLNRVVTKLSSTSDTRSRKFVIKVVKDDSVNAMSLPNGTLFVNTGLLIFVRSESELAGVLAHEMAHVTARHASRNATRQGIWGAATLAVAMFGGGAGPALEPAAHVTSQVFGAKFSRENELEADFYGLQYLHQAGYDTAEFLELLRRISKQEPGERSRLKSMLATHPPTVERLQTARFVVDSFEKHEDQIVDTSSFNDAKAKVIELTHPDSQGASERPVLHITAKAAADPAQ